MDYVSEELLKQELVDFAGRCGTQGWCPGTLGNISALNRRYERVYIKKSGADMSKLSLEDIIPLNLDEQLVKGKEKASIEANIHLGIYKVRKDVGAVFHLHPPFATAYAVAGKKIPLVTEAAKLILRNIPLLPWAPPGSLKLAKIVSKKFRNSEVRVVLLRKHGIVAVGETLIDAYHVAAFTENTAKIAVLSSVIKREKRDLAMI